MQASGVLDSFKSQQEELIASFYQAFSKVAGDGSAKKARLVGSLATALNNLTASAASSIVSVASGGADVFSQNAKAFRADLGKKVAHALDDEATPGNALKALKSEQQALIASFSGALANVASDKPQAAQRLQASLAVALTSLTASASNAIVSVAEDAADNFKANAGRFRTKLAERLKSLAGK